MMKRILCACTIILFISSSIFAGVVKKTKSQVTFKGFGTFTSVQTVKISKEKKLTDSKNEFKGKELMGRLAGKFALKSGEVGEIVDLSAMTICNMDHKKKEYMLRPIQEIEQGEKEEEESVHEDIQKEESVESNVKIIRSEFKVEETGDTKVINKFSCKKYFITWVTEWENTQTGQKGTDRLTTDVWATLVSDDLKQAQEEETQFSREYMKRMGFDTDALQQAILGTNWLAILSGLNQEGGKREQNTSQYAEEMKKIQGYPVIIDGKYYAIREGGPKAEEPEEEGGGARKMLGRFAKKALKKKTENKTDEPSLAYYTELIEFSPVAVSKTELDIPLNYKEKK